MSNSELPLHSPGRIEETVRRISEAIIRTSLATVVISSTAIAAENTPNVPSEICPAPAAVSVEAVEQLYEDTKKSVQTLTGDPERQEKISNLKWPYYETLGVPYTPYDREHYDELAEAIYRPEMSRPYSEYHNFTQEFLQQLDIQLVLGPAEGQNGQAQTPTAAELETTAAKRGVLGFVTLFSETQPSVARELGIKQMHLTAHGEEYAGMAYMGGGKVVYDITNNGEEAEHGEETLDHEFWHMMDARLCGANGAHNDPAYTGLNRHARYAAAWPPPEGFQKAQPITAEQLNVTDETSQLKFAYVQNLNAPPRQYCRAWLGAVAQLRTVEMQSTYSHRSPAEDKAELGTQLNSPWHASEVLDAEGSVIRQKALLQLARQYEAFPKETGFLVIRAALTSTEIYDCDPYKPRFGPLQIDGQITSAAVNPANSPDNLVNMLGGAANK